MDPERNFLLEGCSIQITIIEKLELLVSTKYLSSCGEERRWYYGRWRCHCFGSTTIAVASSPTLSTRTFHLFVTYFIFLILFSLWLLSFSGGVSSDTRSHNTGHISAGSPSENGQRRMSCSCVPQIRTVTFSTECTFTFSTENKKWRQITKVLHLMINLTIYLWSCILSLLVFVFWVNLNCSWYNNLFKQLLLFFPLSFLPTGFEMAVWTTHLQEREIDMAVAYVNGLLLQQHCCGAWRAVIIVY